METQASGPFSGSLLGSADRLASNALSNAPAAELELRGLISTLYLSEGPSLLDATACYQQLKRISQLLPLVPDEKLPAPRDVFRISTATSALWAGHNEAGLSELRALRSEFGRRDRPSEKSIRPGRGRLFHGLDSLL
jgi:hypothetical protein